jgi:membrane protein DedA with SNARE-associated domain
MIHDFLNWVLHLNPALVLTVCGALVFLEDAFFVGFVVPGESAAVVAGVAAGLGHVSLVAAIVVVVIAAIVGDTVGFEIGKHLFARVRGKAFLARHEAKFVKTEEFLRRRGAAAVFLGRFVALFRAMMPAIAGASQMHYPTFLRWNAIGGLVWGTAFVILGHAAGKSWEAIAHQASTGLLIAAGVLLVLAAVAWKVHEIRKNRGA